MNWPLYLSETQMAEFVLGENARKWPAVRLVDERRGLPQIDPLRGGRFRPAVEAFYASLHEHRADPGRPRIVIVEAPDGQERPDGETATAIHRERRPRGDRRARA